MKTELLRERYEPLEVVGRGGEGEVIRALDPATLAITPAGIARAIDYCVDAGHTRELTLEPITEDRRPVFPGGLAILAEIFDPDGFVEASPIGSWTRVD